MAGFRISRSEISDPSISYGVLVYCYLVIAEKILRLSVLAVDEIQEKVPECSKNNDLSVLHLRHTKPAV